MGGGGSGWERVGGGGEGMWVGWNGVGYTIGSPR